MEENNKKHSRKSFLKILSATVGSIGGFSLGMPFLTNKNKENISSSTIKLRKRKRYRGEMLNCDVMVYGGTSAGVIAAYTAKMYGLHVILVEPGRHLGGMSSGGLGKTDTGGNEDFVTGLSKEFYLKVGQYYGDSNPMYRFEPHVAESIFNEYINEAEIEVLYSRRIKNVSTKNSKIISVNLEHTIDNSNIIPLNANIFIDASYEGDLMARSGVSYTFGRESNKKYNEKFNGVILPRTYGPYNRPIKKKSEWPVKIDPYVTPTKSSSGLLPEINGVGHKAIGSGDKSIQAYCFRLCLTQNKDNQIPLSEPVNYNPKTYELLARLLEKNGWETLEDGFIISKMPRGKTDWNNYGYAGFSSDYIGQNFDYPDGDYHARSQIWNDHMEYQKGLLWFLANDERVPSHIKEEMNSWGYCRDEFLDTNGWPHQLYVREARRMVGKFVMTEHECFGRNTVKDGIAYGIYPLDSHPCQRIVVDGYVENEGNTSISGFPPYPISYRSLIPKRTEITNLLVPACFSASHSAFSSIRMEPVFMELGQASGVAAYVAAENDQKLHDINVGTIQKELSENPLPNREVSKKYLDKFSLQFS